MGIASYVLLDTTAGTYATTLSACTAAAVVAWPENEPGVRLSNDGQQALVKVPAGFSIADDAVLAIHEVAPRALLAGPDWQPDMEGAP